MFRKNIGLAGRFARAAAGCALLFYAWWGSSWIALIFALFTFFEAWMSWCVVYQLMGKNSCPKDS
jgi:hypothetical protein